MHSNEIATSARISEETRLEGVSALSWVDFAFILAEPPEHFIHEMKPAVVVMGSEHESKHNPEMSAVETYGGELIFGSGDISFSSLELLQHDTELFNKSDIVRPSKYIEHHQITIATLNDVINRFSDLKVCVIGDLIVDEYVQCDPLGMSQEDPTIVVTPIMANKFIARVSSLLTLGASARRKFISFRSSGMMKARLMRKIH